MKTSIEKAETLRRGIHSAEIKIHNARRVAMKRWNALSSELSSAEFYRIMGERPGDAGFEAYWSRFIK